MTTGRAPKGGNGCEESLHFTAIRSFSHTIILEWLKTFKVEASCTTSDVYYTYECSFKFTDSATSIYINYIDEL